MGRRKKPEPDDREQSDRFIETAERIKSENDKEQFEQACNKVIRRGKGAPPNNSK